MFFSGSKKDVFKRIFSSVHVKITITQLKKQNKYVYLTLPIMFWKYEYIFIYLFVWIEQGQKVTSYLSLDYRIKSFFYFPFSNV